MVTKYNKLLAEKETSVIELHNQLNKKSAMLLQLTNELAEKLLELSETKIKLGQVEAEFSKVRKNGSSAPIERESDQSRKQLQVN